MVYDAARAAVFMNRRDTEPYVRWCGRTAGEQSPASYPIGMGSCRTDYRHQLHRSRCRIGKWHRHHRHRHWIRTDAERH
jgi:hypothetical protein